ncbi:MAG: sugar ABC transporter ATP-binding protein [Treponema sp.]|jgi:ribose transport system ATP-binding protein|nr:sugar ABC transporter ATP-binding protein [Treponema sp.]
MVSDKIVLALEHISKIYPGVTALDDVSVSFRRGEVHALLGENGAGKSTLIKIISGAILPDGGCIRINDVEYKHMTPGLSKKLSIEVIYQEFNLVESLSVAENIFLGERHGFRFDSKYFENKAAELFQELGIDLDPHRAVETFSPAKKQLVEICKSVSKDLKLLIMDEPSAPLSSAEVEIMFGIIGKLKEKGVTIIYISHRMEELFRVSDRVTILRDGCFVKTLNTKETSRQELVSLMVGRELKESYPSRHNEPGAAILELKGLTGNGDRDISFSVRKGEVLGIAGLVGAGRTELANVIFGAVRIEGGEIHIRGRPVNLKSPRDAIRYGMGLIPEDRKLLGCILESSVKFNISLACVKNLSRGFHIIKSREKKLVEHYEEALRIKAPSMEQAVKNLSGGNQQKVVLAKALAAEPEILIFDEPTRGIDVGAKQEIYKLMNDLAEAGKAIIMISSDLEELLGMSDRMLVLHEGKSAGEVEKGEAGPELVIGLASGMKKEELVCTN